MILISHNYLEHHNYYVIYVSTTVVWGNAFELAIKCPGSRNALPGKNSSTLLFGKVGVHLMRFSRDFH